MYIYIISRIYIYIYIYAFSCNKQLNFPNKLTQSFHAGNIETKHKCCSYTTLSRASVFSAADGFLEKKKLDQP